jgi:hypothetical protein
MPAETANDAGSLSDEFIAVVNEDPHLPLGPIQLRDRQVWLASAPVRAGAQPFGHRRISCSTVTRERRMEPTKPTTQSASWRSGSRAA